MTATDWRAKDTALTLAIGVGGALFFWLIGFPAAVLTGPAAAVSIATIWGLPAHVPPLLRDACFLALGVSIGSTVTPEVIQTAATWPLSLAGLGLSLALSIFAARLLLSKGFGFNRMTALLASTPGHLSYVLGLSTDVDADVPRVALVQSVRVLVLTLMVPLLIAAWGAEGDSYLGDRAPIGAVTLVGIMAVSLALGLVFKRLRIPAPLLLGGIVISAIGHGSSLTPGVMPSWLTMAAFVVMGTLIGTRFNGISRAEVLSALGAGLAAAVLACAIAAVAAVLAGYLVDVPTAAVLLAFAPGGVEVMAAIAVETGLEPAFVAAHHVFRLIFLTVLVPILLTAERRR